MPGSISSSIAVDLSRLPAPDLVEALDFETIFAAMRADLIERLPSFDALLESDPAIKILQVAAYRELLLRQRVNEAGRAVMIAFAAGGDLDNLGAVFGVTRNEITPADEQAGTPAVMESDDDLRRRILLAPDSYSVAGPASAYVYHALSASGEVLDASATSPAPGEVVVAVLSRIGNGEASEDLLGLVDAALSSDTVRPLTDQVTVQAAGLIHFDVQATLYLYAGPDSNLIKQSARDALAAKLEELRRIGRDVPRSAIIAALHVAGVQRVDLAEPDADVTVSEIEAPAPDEIVLFTEVSDE